MFWTSLSSLLFVNCFAQFDQCQTREIVNCEDFISYKIFINETQKRSNNYCENTQVQRYAYFVQIQSHQNELLIDTCDSDDGSSYFEIIDQCDNSLCLISSSKQCGSHAYIRYTNESSINIILRVICLEPSCHLVLRIQPITKYQYDTCFNAKVIDQNTNDLFSINELKYSSHGCYGKEIKSKGKWYFIKSNLNYKSIKINAYGITNHNYIPIELKNGCNDYYCSVRNGPFYIDSSFSKYIFIDSGSNDDNIKVQIEYINEIPYSNDCSTAQEIKLPYSTVLCNYNQLLTQDYCDKTKTNANTFVLVVTESSLITLSTQSTQLNYDSIISVANGSCDKYTCIKKSTPLTKNGNEKKQIIEKEENE
ncbi:hypothetical protein EHI8A_023960 [Entamoeba histolytica HM-1:IMSS-B]|uniref:Uncharacterized protein n=4 Tax=Entamoeba histolytica TaxID=5759 RepID=M3URE8_ENTH1|nr:hypothetical protein EHI8A_023960 [Entamoeba histolytica HM-1:IMSS-B]EMS17639.1 hypothetical protein KM1_005170 [Entamoeba histolytica HM-3:IMSS]